MWLRSGPHKSRKENTVSVRRSNGNTAMIDRTADKSPQTPLLRRGERLSASAFVKPGKDIIMHCTKQGLVAGEVG